MEELPNELILSIITHLENPAQFSQTSRRMLLLSKDPLVRAQWLLNRYGSHAFEASFMWSKVSTLDTLNYLILLLPRIPRYQIQRAIARYQYTDNLDCLLRILQYGRDMYKTLSLNKQDTMLFSEVTAAQAGFNAGMGVLGSMTTDAAALETLRMLVQDYGFSVNYTKFSAQPGISLLDVNEGYRTFLAAIGANNVRLVRALLDYGAVTHIAKPATSFLRLGIRALGLEAGMPNRRQLYGLDMDRFAQSHYSHYFPSDLRQYSTPTADALIMAARSKNVEIVRLLLDHDIERWNEEAGLKVLKTVLQLAVDENFTQGAEIIRSYLTSNEGTPKKSPSALKKLLVDAVMRDNFEDVQNLILKEGARFETPGVVDMFHRQIDVFRNIILGDKRAILSFLLKNYPTLTDYQLGDMLIHAIETNNAGIISMLLNNKNCKPRILDRTLRRAMMKSCYDAFPGLLKALLDQQPHKTPSGWKQLLRVAEKRKKDGKDPEGFFLTHLQQHEDKLHKIIIRGFATSKAKTKRSKRAKYDDEEEDEFDSAADDDDDFAGFDDDDGEFHMPPIPPSKPIACTRPKRKSAQKATDYKETNDEEEETAEGSEADDISSHVPSATTSENERDVGGCSGRRRSSRRKGKEAFRRHPQDEANGPGTLELLQSILKMTSSPPKKEKKTDDLVQRWHQGQKD
ncbi:hypothetical protein SeMB42_g01895 [Synchytrium endobioticum]|uniref:F-box domain-containing protein n=1 Tax=Synchytrium endobioticum TaxID=286115 RepID=A0A507DJU5_9FUNG|nr:hypothetical protein SeMB42_g01895 [Synchytrium endobioticum]